MTDWKKTLTSLGAREDAPAPTPPQDLAPAPAADPGDFPEWVLAFACAASDLVGERDLLERLRRFLGAEQTNRTAGALEGWLRGALERLPSGRARELREAGCDPARLWRGKGVPTFSGSCELVLEALESGAATRWRSELRELATAAERLSPPEALPGEALEDYAARCRAWADEVPEAVLRAAGVDAWTLERAERERREEAERREREERDAAEERARRDALARLASDGDLEAFQAAVGWSWEKLAGTLPQAWDWWHRGLGIDLRYVTSDPGEWLASLQGLDAEERQVLLRRPDAWKEEHLSAFKAAAADLFGLPPEGRALVVRDLRRERTGTAYERERPQWWAIGADGGVHLVEAQVPEAADVPVSPDPGGWVAPRYRAKFGDRSWPPARWLGPKRYQAIQVVEAHVPRGVDLSAWAGCYGVHPDRGFGRFRVGVSFGRSSDFRVVSVCDRTAAYLAHVERYPYELPAGAWRVPVRVRATERGAHLVWDERAPAGAAYYEGAHWQQLSRRSVGDSVGLSDGSTAAWSASGSASTAKHSVTFVAGIVLDGQRLCLSTGAAWACDGGNLSKVPGGADLG